MDRRVDQEVENCWVRKSLYTSMPMTNLLVLFVCSEVDPPSPCQNYILAVMLRPLYSRFLFLYPKSALLHVLFGSTFAVCRGSELFAR